MREYWKFQGELFIFETEYRLTLYTHDDFPVL